MTPRTKDAGKVLDLADFSEVLLSQLRTPQREFDLTGLDKISNLIHPALLKCQLAFRQSPQNLDLRNQVKNYHVRCFSSMDLAREHYPGIQCFGGHPYNIWQFINSVPDNALLDCGEYGAVYLSKTEEFSSPETPEIHHFIVPLWLDYALSEELWGPQGKWTRFHKRFHTLFENNSLLIEQDNPGYYPLGPKASFLKGHGYKGLESASSFVLVPQWDFPLSALIRLEKLLSREV